MPKIQVVVEVKVKLVEVVGEHDNRRPEMRSPLPMDVAEAWAFVAIHEVAVGDEHPTRKGWFLVEELGARGEPMWYRPPSRSARFAAGLCCDRVCG